MKKEITNSFIWPLKCFSEIDNAGKFPFEDQDFSKNYCSVNHHAIHLYNYSGKIRLAEREYEIVPGMMSITPQFSNAQYHLASPGHHYCIHFRVGLSVDKEIFTLPLVFSSGHYHQEAILRIMEIAGMLMYARADATEQARIGLEFQNLMLWLSGIVKHQTDDARVENPGVTRAVAIIERGLTAKLSVPKIAKEAKISQNYLALLFRKQFGMTIPHYILERRLEYAKTLLSISDMKIKEIADQSGIADPQYFNKQFRRIVGISPSEYRRVLNN